MDKFLSGKITDRYNTASETERDMVQLNEQLNHLNINTLPTIRRDLEDKLDKKDYEKSEALLMAHINDRFDRIDSRIDNELFEQRESLFWIVYLICNSLFMRFFNFFGHWYVIDHKMNGLCCEIREPTSTEDFHNHWRFYRSRRGKEWRKIFEQKHKKPLSFGCM